MTGEQLTALFLLLLTLLVCLLFGFWTGIEGVFAGLHAVARGVPMLFGIGLLLLASGTWDGLRRAALALFCGVILATAAVLLGPASGFAEGRALVLIEAGWLLLLAALAWAAAPARWILLALVAVVATTLPGAYAAELAPTHLAAGLAAILVLQAGGVMLTMLAQLLSGIARPARIVAALAAAAALARLTGGLE